MANKMTYVQAIDNALQVVEGETAERLQALKQTLVKRNAKRVTKKNDVNAGFKAQIMQVLQVLGRPATVSDILATNVLEAGTSNQKVTSMLTQMVKAQEVVRETDKKKAFYSLPVAPAAEETETEEVVEEA